ncbi:MAG: SUMF1/EgtB/PvdO family nonheme iron enzyme [Opitutaceae bacterium]|nr:SUMF1/EgtB/PvdO family nonheme iron enzyme [Opitutaceae bacterium]
MQSKLPQNLHAHTRKPARGLALLIAALASFAAAAADTAGIELVEIPAGSFAMGSTKGHWNEQPVRKVTISRPFLISKYEVTRLQFLEFRKDHPTSATQKGIGVSWNEAVAYCEWLSKKEGKPYRLPTEAEWEYACRLEGTSGEGQLVGMLDDVVEWCQDWYSPYPDQEEVDPTGPAEGMVRVLRGDKLDVDDRVIAPWGYNRPAYRAGLPPDFGRPLVSLNIGFRVVQAPPVSTPPRAIIPELFRLGVKQSTAAPASRNHPDPSKPYFRKRYLVATPPETWEGNRFERPQHAKNMEALALHPGLAGHQHSAALEVLPNGDLLMVAYTSWTEYNPEVALMAVRLRYGHDTWEMPSFGFDLPSVNDHAPLLWTDGSATHLFWGAPKLPEHIPFQWTTTRDSGATWEEVRLPTFSGPIGPSNAQPINTAFRDRLGTLYMASDGVGNESLLWASDDNMKTWRDPGGRTNGGHSTFALLSDGVSILAMNGRKTHIDYYMTSSTSHDRAASFVTGKTPFAWGGSNQRASLLRLRSGRLLFATDVKHSVDRSPKEFDGMQGSILAVSDDDGKTWRKKKLAGGQLHETRKVRGFGTIGYSVLRQGSDDLIHLITTMTEPCLHFTFNEAWLDAPEGEEGDAVLMRNSATTITSVSDYSERYSDGKTRITWRAGIANDGRYLLHGPEKWFFPDGKLQYEANFALGRKVGSEILYDNTGRKLWAWTHQEDGTSLWTQYWPNGSRKAESSWKDLHAEGMARRWDSAGNLISEKKFVRGKAD